MNLVSKQRNTNESRGLLRDSQQEGLREIEEPCSESTARPWVSDGGEGPPGGKPSPEVPASLTITGQGTFLASIFLFKKKSGLDFPGGPVVKTPRFHRKGCRFDPWLGN